MLISTLIVKTPPPVIAAATQEGDPMTVLPHITTFGWVPEFARGFVCNLRPRSVFEEVGQPYEVDLISDAKPPE